MNTIIADFEALWAKIKPELEAIGSEIWSIAKQLWTADTTIVMTDLQKGLTNVAVQLQNDQPGIDSKTMFAQLVAAVTTQFASIGAQLVYEDITLVVSIVIKQLNVPATQGNAGVVS